MSRIKLFSIYYSKGNIFTKELVRTDIIEPIQTGRASSKLELRILGDDTGDNISLRNPYYGEITCWYWVWKNYLKEHREIEYIGFTQYRRLPVLFPLKEKDRHGHYLKLVSKEAFEKAASSFTLSNVEKEIEGWDLILTKEWHTGVSTAWQFTSFLPPDEWRRARHVFTAHSDEEELKFFNKVMNRSSARYKCNFIMKRELFEEFMDWLFSRLFEFEELSLWKDNYPPEKRMARISAFITEAFVNLWYDKVLEREDIRVKEVCLYEAKMPKKMTKDNVDRIKWALSVFKHLKEIRLAKLPYKTTNM